MVELESWDSPEFVAAWAGEDVAAGMLELPRRVSTAIVADAGIDVRHVVDLGAGPGAYLEHFLRAFPEARGTWTDSSAAMLDLARERLAGYGDRVAHVLVDAEQLGEATLEPADVVVTSRVSHHFSIESLARMYRAVHELLVRGGFFFNLDHVGSPGDWEQVYRRVRTQFAGTRTKPLARHRHDHPLAATDVHLRCAREAGFEAPDTAWRMLTTALVVARR